MARNLLLKLQSIFLTLNDGDVEGSPVLTVSCTPSQTDTLCSLFCPAATLMVQCTGKWTAASNVPKQQPGAARTPMPYGSKVETHPPNRQASEP